MKNEIWAIMVRKKVFTPKEVVEELLNTKYKFLGKSFLRNKVKDFIRQQVKSNSLTQVLDGIFALTPYSDNWEEYITKRNCVVCNNPFIPLENNHIICSPECKREYYKEYHSKTRRKKGMKPKRRWTDKEVEKLKQLKEKGYTYEEIAKRLNRTKTAVIEKYKQLKGVRK